MSSLVIPAPRPEVEAEPIIQNTFFWPAVDPAVMRDILRYEGTITPLRLRHAVKSAIAEVNTELWEYRKEQMALGFTLLAEVPADQIDGESIKLSEYRRAVSSITAASLAERYRGYDASANGGKKADEVESRIDELWRDARFSISNVAGKRHCIIGLL
ncbi:head completion/stabilization protein [Sodalis sp. RH24]|uniref:head completion/stabilization protein n=1 Tax=unclassified Sodalis (in: enterobacteria) TaxID=2636512 RepID=UPI0039B61506